MDVIEEFKFFLGKFTKKKIWGGERVGSGRGGGLGQGGARVGGGQGGCERRIEVFVKIQKKNWGWGGGGGVGRGGSGWM